MLRTPNCLREVMVRGNPKVGHVECRAEHPTKGTRHVKHDFIARSARNFFAKGVEAVYKQSQINSTFLLDQMYRPIFHSFRGM